MLKFYNTSEIEFKENQVGGIQAQIDWSVRIFAIGLPKIQCDWDNTFYSILEERTLEKMRRASAEATENKNEKTT